MNFMDEVINQASSYHGVSKLFNEFFKLVKSNSSILTPLIILFVYHQFKTEFSVSSVTGYPFEVQNQNQIPLVNLDLMERGSPLRECCGGCCLCLAFVFLFQFFTKVCEFYVKLFSYSFWCSLVRFVLLFLFCHFSLILCLSKASSPKHLGGNFSVRALAAELGYFFNQDRQRLENKNICCFFFF